MRKPFRYPAWKLLNFIILVLFCTTVTACTLFPTQTPEAAPTETVTPQPPLTAEGLGFDQYAQPVPEEVTEITFAVMVPENTPGDSVVLSLSDEVTGLALNTTKTLLEPVEQPAQPGSWFSTTLSFPVGAMVTYRYERLRGDVPIAEHISDGSAVRYRAYHVEGPGNVADVVNCWTDTPCTFQSGRIKGQILDADSGQSIPNILVLAGGLQTITASDGFFQLEGLPPGTHNLVAISMDGAYQSFQQGATVAPDSTTPAPVMMKKSTLVNIAFVVRLPEETPPIIPVRIAGNLFQLGNTFSNLAGGISSLAVNMPFLTALPDRRYYVNLQLPVGADIQYKYTLGDGFWNAEHATDGTFRLRRLIVPPQDTLVLDEVSTWRSGDQGALTFDITVPASTPSGDTVSIQFSPIFGWTVPLPMWSLGEGRWAYILFSPLNIPGDLVYRFCRNGQCGRTDDVRTAGDINPGLSVSVTDEPQILEDTILDWSMLPQKLPATSWITPTVTLDTRQLALGVELEAAYHPSYRALLPQTLGEVVDLGANWMVATPTWTFTHQNPPVLEAVTGQDATWLENLTSLTFAHDQGLKTAIFPEVRFFESKDTWWQSAGRDYGWWINWFENYRTFIIHFADLAMQTNANTLIIGGDWVLPALPMATMVDGSPSGVSTDAESQWRGLIAELRAHYSGAILWAIPADQISHTPAFFDSLDGLYILWDTPLAESSDAPVEQLAQKAGELLDASIKPLQDAYQKPIWLAVSYPAAEGSLEGCILTITGDCYPTKDLATSSSVIFNLSLNLQNQVDAYSAMLEAISIRPWISGFVSRGFYAPAKLIDPGPSIHGKPAGDYLKLWFKK